MNIVGSAITAALALVGVLLGGWLTLRNQDRAGQRDHARQWRDIRLATYADFLTAYRDYISFVLEPTAQISTRPHPGKPGSLMPFFDENGRPYKEKFEATKTAVRLVGDVSTTVTSADRLVHRARDVASARATRPADGIPHEHFQPLWAAERAFLAAARNELGLAITTGTPSDGAPNSPMGGKTSSPWAR